MYLLVPWQKPNSNLLRQEGDISSFSIKLMVRNVPPLGTPPARRSDYWQNSLTTSHAFYFHVHSIFPDTSFTRLKQWQPFWYRKRSFCCFPLEKLYRDLGLTTCDLEQCNVTRRVGSIKNVAFAQPVSGRRGRKNVFKKRSEQWSKQNCHTCMLAFHKCFWSNYSVPSTGLGAAAEWGRTVRIIQIIFK